MSAKKTGGPAFPLPYEFSREVEKANEKGLIPENDAMDALEKMMGITVRDYFAAKAMQAIVAGAITSGALGEENAKHAVCEAAFRLADAMLEARKS